MTLAVQHRGVIPPTSLSCAWDSEANEAVPLRAGAAIITATIAEGASDTGAIDLGNGRLSLIQFPSEWTAADVIFLVSLDGVTYGGLCIVPAHYQVLVYTRQVEAGMIMPVEPELFRAVRYLKIRSSSSGSAVNQAAARTLRLATVF